MESFPAYGTWKHATRCVDVEKAEATKPSDIDMIMVGIKALEPVTEKDNAAFDGRELGGVARETSFFDSSCASKQPTKACCCRDERLPEIHVGGVDSEAVLGEGEI